MQFIPHERNLCNNKSEILHSGASLNPDTQSTCIHYRRADRQTYIDLIEMDELRIARQMSFHPD